MLGSLPIMATFGVRFYRKQRAGALGGAMSKPKAYWLSFAIWFWFLVCPAAALDDVLALPVRMALGAFGISMWLRGAAEMVMLYVTKNWRPPLGVGHDGLCIALIAGVLFWHGPAALMPARGLDPYGLDRWGLALVATVLVSLVVEIHHAASFHRAVEGRTTGDEGIWFADEEQERFRQINQNTLVWNVVLSTLVGGFVLRWVSWGWLP